MCGRYVSPDEAAIERAWHVGRISNPLAGRFPARYNVAPQQGNPAFHVPVIRVGEQERPGLAMMQWWLLPHWSKSPRIRHSTFNARVETVAAAPSFRVPFRQRRCLIPACGWYEWQELPGGKQPWYIRAPDGEPVAIAGLWDVWEGKAQIIESCAMIVGGANNAVGHFHDRMPFLIAKEHSEAWLDPTLDDPETIMALLKPAADAAVVCCRVTTLVNNARNDRPQLIQPLDEQDDKRYPSLF